MLPCHSMNTKKSTSSRLSIYSLFHFLHLSSLLFSSLYSLSIYIHSPSILITHIHTILISFIPTIIYISHFSISSDYLRMSRPGDWNCRSCQHLNFQRRDSCQRCGDSKYGDRMDFGGFGSRVGSSFGFSGGSDVRPGDWYCAASNCGAHNFASRSSCFKCGAFKDDLAGAFTASRAFGAGAGGGNRPGWKSGDWICNRSGCNEHNFASRMECFKCSAPRDTY